MKVTTIIYERLVPTYPYANFRVGLMADLADGDDLAESYAQLVDAATGLARREMARIDPYYALPEDERMAAALRRTPQPSTDGYPPEPISE